MTSEACTDMEAFGAMESIDWADSALASPLAPTSKHDRLQIVRTVGERMREARELNCLSQSEAARQFGYANPSKLSKVESASDTKSVPIWLVIAAARVYDVSADWLLGLSSDWETGLPRGTQGFLMDAWQKMRLRDIGLLDRCHAEAVTLSATTNALVDAVAAVGLALSKYDTANPNFQDTRGSATLVAAIAKLEADAKAAEAGLKHYQLRTSTRGSAM